MSMAPTLVEAHNLTRVFDVSKPWLNRLLEREPRTLLTAVTGVSFSIGKRETLALVGESGSGKSTVARMIVGLLPPTVGSVSIDGIDMWAPASAGQRQKLRRRLQMIFQDPYASLNPRWRVDRIIADPIKAFRLAANRTQIDDRVAELLRLVGLDPADGRKYPHEFSGGQRQRICIARALSSNPEFIVCDEPTSALDVSVQAQILNLMRDLQDRLGLSYFFISHNLAVVKHMAARIGVMYLGRIVELAPSGELFKTPRHPYSRMLIDALPDLAMSGRQRRPIEGEIPNPIKPPTGCAFHPRCPHAFERCRRKRRNCRRQAGQAPPATPSPRKDLRPTFPRQPLGARGWARRGLRAAPGATKPSDRGPPGFEATHRGLGVCGLQRQTGRCLEGRMPATQGAPSTRASSPLHARLIAIRFHGHSLVRDLILAADLTSNPVADPPASKQATRLGDAPVTGFKLSEAAVPDRCKRLRVPGRPQNCPGATFS